MPKHISEFNRLAGEPFSWMYENDPGAPTAFLGGQADLTPLRNKAREAAEALNDCMRATDSGKADDAVEALRRAKAAIDAALGGQVGPYGPGPGPGTGMGR